ncbi:MAG: 8-oxoguanine deaminase [Armatimonadota bacterium]
MKTLLIKNADFIVTLNDKNEILKGSDIYIEGPEIKKIGNLGDIKADEVINASGKYIYPGMVNTHHHLYQTFTRNVPQVQSAELFDWLIYLYEVWKRFSPEDFYYSALVGLGELLLTGCTTAVDMFYVFPKTAGGEIFDVLAKAGQDLGIRLAPCRGSMSRSKKDGGLPPDAVVQTVDEILADSERVIKKYHSADKFSMCQVILGPCSPFSVTKELMKETAVFARKHDKVYLHTHLAETEDENDFCKEIYKMRPYELMEDIGWTGEDVFFAHCVHLNDAEIKKMAQTKTGVAHCPTSNMRLGSGVAPVPEMLKKGVNVSLAVDGSASNDSSDMLGEARQALLVHRIKGADRIKPLDVWKIASCGGAKVLGRTELGSLEAGKAADLFMVDTNKLGYAGVYPEPLGLPLLTGNTHIVDTTIVNGEIVVRNGRLTKLNEEEIIERANILAAKLYK